MSSSRRRKAGRSGDAREKKAKVASASEEARFWTSMDEIPEEPPGDGLNNQKLDFQEKLSESLLEAVKTGNVMFARQLIQAKRGLLAFQKHVPQRNYTDATAHLLALQKITPPVQPKFGIRDFICGGLYRPMRKNLLIEAIRNNQFGMLRELVQLNIFDINAMSYRHGGYNSDLLNPLVCAIEEGHKEMICFLLDQPNILLTHPQTVQKRHGGRYRPRSEPTALSEAADRGHMDIVERLIQQGALEPASTSRPDDPYSLVKTNPNEAKMLVHFSINEAILNAYHKADAFGGMDRETDIGHQKKYADILAVLLSLTGPQENNAITVYVIDRIRLNQWNNIHSASLYSYDYNPFNDRDFCPTTGKPSLRALAVARGLRAVHPDCLRGIIPNMSGDELVRYRAKYQQWSELIQVCRKRLEEAGPDWIDAELTALPGDHPFAPDTAFRRKRMLFWCHLFACSPWSKEVHHHHSSPRVKLYVGELLRIGSQLNLRHQEQAVSASETLKDIWDRDIVPFVVE